MLRAAMGWLGFAGSHPASGHGHHHHHGEGPGHTHGVVDPTIASTARGIWAIKWSFAILAVTAGFQTIVVLTSGSVALLADTIHNVGDAATAIPLWIAFLFARRKPSRRFTYGLGRVEDLAGAAIVAIILFSAIVAGYQAIDRLIHPRPIAGLGWVAAAGVIGFAGNEAVAILRIRVGRQIHSAALIADGYHARVDGLTSLAVVLGAAGVWAGFPLADPLVGLIITAAIFAIVWQSAKAVFERMLDGVDPALIDELRHAAEHVAAVRGVLGIRARWLGHRLTAEVDIAVDDAVTVGEVEQIVAAVDEELRSHVSPLAFTHIRPRPATATRMSQAVHQPTPHHHHAPTPVRVSGRLAEGVVEIVETPAGERMRFSAARLSDDTEALVEISRDGKPPETLLMAEASNRLQLMSDVAPAEPHEFVARLILRRGAEREELSFTMSEPLGHHR